MVALFGAKFAAVGSACGRCCGLDIVTVMALVVAAGLLAACGPATLRLAGRDPADPAAKIAGVDDSSTTAPHRSLRPSTPASWRERNDSVAPRQKPKTESMTESMTESESAR
jgi:hypothetical protein